MTKVAIWARIPLKPGTREEAAKGLQACIDNAHTEAGTLLYILHEDPADPDAVFFYDLYADSDALTVHGSGPGMKVMGSVLKEFGDGRAEMRFLTPISGKGL
ncbi:MAG: putative quinol monooxygenase [Ilumatobacteraceae bacterium]|jgi:quinol monooxygenase YgiN